MLDRMLERLGADEDPALAAVLAVLRHEVLRGGLDPILVEPSFALGTRGVRLGVNAAADRDAPVARLRRTLAIAEAIGIPVAAIETTVTSWLADPAREVFLAWASEGSRLRAKLYLRAPIDADDALVAVASTLGARATPRGCTTCSLDYAEGARVGEKWYRPVPWIDVERAHGALALVRVVGAPAPALLSERFDASGARVGATLHLAVHSLGRPALGEALADELGFAEDMASLASLRRAVPLVPRVLSQDIADPRRAAVYLGLRAGARPA